MNSLISEKAPGPAPIRRMHLGVVWNFAAVASNQGSTLLCQIIVARLLGQSVFGAYSIIQSTILTCLGLVQLSLGYTATKFVAQYRSVDPSRTELIMGFCFGLTLVSSLLGVLVLWGCADVIATTILHQPGLANLLRISATAVLLMSINACQTGILAGLEKYPSLARAGMLSGIGAIILLAAGAMTRSITITVWAYTLSAFLRCVIHGFVLVRDLRSIGLRIRFRGAIREMDIFRNFALPAVLGSYLHLPATWLASASLVRQPNGLLLIAAYAIGTQIRMAVLVMPNIINTVGLSVLSNAKGKQDREIYRNVSRRNLQMMVGGAAVIAGGMSLMLRPILRIYGKNFDIDIRVPLVLLASTIPETAYTALYQRIYANGRMWQSFLGIMVPWQICFCAAAWMLVPRNGALGLAVAYLLGSCVQCGFTIYQSRGL